MYSPASNLDQSLLRAVNPRERRKPMRRWQAQTTPGYGVNPTVIGRSPVEIERIVRYVCRAGPVARDGWPPSERAEDRAEAPRKRTRRWNDGWTLRSR